MQTVKKTSEQRVAEIRNEGEPAWWNSLTDRQRDQYKRNVEAAMSAAFEAGVRAGLKAQ